MTGRITLTRSPGLAGRVALFADFLRSRGFRVFQSGIHDALLSLNKIDISEKQDFLTVLRINLATSDLEWSQFPGLFEEFWGHGQKNNNGSKNDESSPGQHVIKEISDCEITRESGADQSVDAPAIEEKKEWLEGIAYSPVSRLEKKDLSRFDDSDIQVARLALKKMVEPFRIQICPRSRRSRKSGRFDFPRIMRKSLKTGGLPVDLFYREKKKRLKRLVILADVSGSMERYARFVMPFILGIKGAGSRAEVFVFSTSLSSITFIIKHLDFEKALERISSEIPNWSGGTKIGYSLHQFNQWEGGRLVNQRTVMVILSDGWDLGGKDLLKREMEALSRKAYCIIWLNPLAGDPEYEPMCRGMKTALPYVDYFLPVNSLEDLNRVGRLLSRIMIYHS